MNPKVARKLGEVFAFAQVGVETLEKGRTALYELLGGTEFDRLLIESTGHMEQLQRIAGEMNVTDAVTEKAAATGDKLRRMRDLYVQDKWDDATELLEWGGFFEGAAIVHWSLVQGAAQSMAHRGLEQLSVDALTYHQEFLQNITDALNNVGQTIAIQLSA